MRYLLVCISFVLASCSSSPVVKVDKRGTMTVDHYQTFSIEEPASTSLQATDKTLSSLSAKLRSTLETALIDRNLRASTGDQMPDITIQLFVNQTPAWDVFEYSQFVYIGRSAYEEYYFTHSFHYEVGTVTVRMKDSGNGKLIWEADISTPLAHSDQQAAERLSESFGRLF